VLALLDEAWALGYCLLPQSVGRLQFHTRLDSRNAVPLRFPRPNDLVSRRIGEALEALAGDYVTLYLSELAHHFFQAGGLAALLAKRSRTPLERRGSHCGAPRYEEAIVHYETALQMLSFKGQTKTTL